MFRNKFTMPEEEKQVIKVIIGYKEISWTNITTLMQVNFNIDWR